MDVVWDYLDVVGLVVTLHQLQLIHQILSDLELHSVLCLAPMLVAIMLQEDREYVEWV